MSQNQPQDSTVPQAAAEGPHVVPPPAGYPTKYEAEPQNPPPAETQSRGGFWRGCCAGLCCCCVLDACF